jgi:hypothetical protein
MRGYEGVNRRLTRLEAWVGQQQPNHFISVVRMPHDVPHACWDAWLHSNVRRACGRHWEGTSPSSDRVPRRRRQERQVKQENRAHGV